ncbi:MAG: hypothetical protein WCG45_00605 [bacterium]
MKKTNEISSILSYLFIKTGIDLNEMDLKKIQYLEKEICLCSFVYKCHAGIFHRMTFLVWMKEEKVLEHYRLY